MPGYSPISMNRTSFGTIALRSARTLLSFRNSGRPSSRAALGGVGTSVACFQPLLNRLDPLSEVVKLSEFGVLVEDVSGREPPQSGSGYFSAKGLALSLPSRVES